MKCTFVCTTIQNASGRRILSLVINAHWNGVDAQANKLALQRKNAGVPYMVVEYDPWTGPAPYNMTPEQVAAFNDACRDMLSWKYGVECHADAMRLSAQVNC